MLQYVHKALEIHGLVKAMPVHNGLCQYIRSWKWVMPVHKVLEMGYAST